MRRTRRTQARYLVLGAVALLGLSVVPASASSAESQGGGSPAGCGGDNQWFSDQGASPFSLINPVGRVESFDPAASSGTFIWCDGNTWHLRTTDFLNKTARYAGKIDIENGSFLTIHSFRLEPDDPWQASSNDEITYQFLTWSGVDGLDFRMTGSTNSVTFTFIRKDDPQAPSTIFIGEDGQHANTNTITFTRGDLNAPASPAGGGAGSASGGSANSHHVTGLHETGSGEIRIKSFGVFATHSHR